MINGLYSGAAAMETLTKHQELIASNLMHVNTSGHRRASPAVKQRFEAEFPNTTIDLGPEVETVATDFEPGRHVPTDRPLDVAINGDGFLVFDNNGTDYLSRNGRLFRNPETGLLVNEEGIQVQGVAGPIAIDSRVADRNIAIAPDGTVSAGGETFGQLRLVAYQNNGDLIPVGATGFTPGNNAIESDRAVTVAQFHHELSNVHPVNELVALIVNSRHHEAVEKATRTLSETLREYIRG